MCPVSASVTSVASECKRAQSAISPAMSRVLACCAVSRISCHHTHKQTQATATLQHVPALHATTNTRLPSHTSTHTHAQQWTSLRGSRPSLSRPNGGLSRVSGVSAVWLRGPGPLKQRQGGREAGRQGGSSKTELRERRDSEQRWRRVCVLGCQETERVLGGEETDQQRPPALQPPPGRLPRAPCSRSWPPRVGRG